MFVVIGLVAFAAAEVSVTSLARSLRVVPRSQWERGGASSVVIKGSIKGGGRRVRVEREERGE